MASTYLTSARKVFQDYKLLGEKAMAQLTEQELCWRADENDNSIALIVKHLRGNMLSRWTHFLTTDGEKPDRQRDLEFEGSHMTSTELLLLWEEGWACLFAAMSELREEDLSRVVHIRREPHTVLEAINRQLAHYPYHVGQIVYLAKQAKGGGWKSLSIPKGQSEQFNKGK
jgi:hypothetical protein